MTSIDMPTTGAVPVVPARRDAQLAASTAPVNTSHPTNKATGVAASIFASVAFASLFGVPGFFVDVPPLAVFGWRILIALPFLAVIITVLRQWTEFGRVLTRMRRKPSLVLVLLANACMFGFQVFLFAWGPMSGQGLAVSMGYFLLPLVLVAVGFMLFKERLSRWGVIAVIFAVAGVTIAIAVGGTVGWATFAVAIGYPPYLILRRRFGLSSPAALAMEMMLLVPVALWLVLQPVAIGAMLTHPGNWFAAISLGLLTAIGFSAYTLAQRDLTMSVFGLLGYLEPVLLVVVATVLLGEPLGLGDAFSYGAIALAIVSLSLDGLPRRRGQDAVLPSRRRRRVVRRAGAQRPESASARR